MKIAALKEPVASDPRAILIPDTVKRLVQKGMEIIIESGLGEGCGYSDSGYIAAGAKVSSNRDEILREADLVLRIRKPALEEVLLMRPGSVQVSFLDPFNDDVIVGALARARISAISLEMIPRITRAQKMDVLSSQANLAGYVSVLLAANYCKKVFPMMTTAAGTLSPARVFVLGAGVAGLQAIATAKRLGAKVTAFDTRPIVEEQVKSLGAVFLKIDLGQTGQTANGYAKALTDEQLQKQRSELKRICAESDVVISTAQVFGKRAPILITKDMIKAMKPGSAVVDCAVESGGNVEDTPVNQIVNWDGVTVIGLKNLPGRVPIHASQVLSANYSAFIEEFWDNQTKKFCLRLDDEIIKNCLITHGGEVCHPLLKNKN